jgi:hypothetical protein
MKPEYLLKSQKIAMSMSAMEYEVIRLTFAMARQARWQAERFEALPAKDRKNMKRVLQRRDYDRVLEVSVEGASYLRDALSEVGGTGDVKIAFTSDLAQQIGNFVLDFSFQQTLFGELPADFGESPTNQA